MKNGRLRRLGAALLALFLLLCAVPAAAASVGRTVRVGYFPFEGFHEIGADGSFSGYDYAYLQKIAQYTGWNYRFVTASWQDCLKMLEKGEIDLLGAVERIPEWEAAYDFASLQTGISSACLFTRGDDLRYFYRDYDAFDGMRVGVLSSGSRNESLRELCEENGFSVHATGYETEGELLGALSSGQIDAALLSNARRLDGYRVIDEFDPMPYYYATTKGNAALLGELNDALGQIKAKDLYYDYALYQRYYTGHKTAPPVFTRAEQEAIASCPEIPVALATDQAPLSWLNRETGEYHGIAVDLLRRVSQRSGLQFTWLPFESSDRAADLLREGGARLAVPVMNSEIWRAPDGLTALEPVFESSLVLIGRTGEAFAPQGPFTIAVPGRFARNQPYLRERYPNATFLSAENDAACLRMLVEKKADITLSDLIVADNLLQSPRYEGFSILPTYSYPAWFCIGAPDTEDPLILSVLNKTVGSLGGEEIGQIVTENTVAQRYQMTLGDLWHRFGLPMFVIGIMLLLLFAAMALVLLVRQRGARRLAEMNRHLCEALAQKEAADETNRMLAQHQEELRFLAEHDDLTGIYNKRAFSRRVREVLNANPGVRYCVIRADLDRFKVYNDLYGIGSGDQLLVSIGAMLQRNIPEGVIYCRLEADHFAFFWPEERLSIERLVDLAARWLSEYPSDFQFSACFGIYPVDDPSIDVGLMCDRALLALRTVKGRYGKRYAYYDETLRDHLVLEQEIVSSMAAALEDGEFEVYFQPQYRYPERELIGAEALVRWNHPVKGMISPALFIPIFEENGFITSLDEYVWEQSCRCLSGWMRQKDICRAVPVSVNISRRDLSNPNLQKILLGLLDRYGVPASMLKLEITESAYVENPVQLIGIVEQLQKSGFSVQMDDFGSGYSSLNTLKDVPVDMLKLDLKFLSGAHNVRGGNILNSVVRMARWLDLPVIAEGVEAEDQAKFLCSIGCTRMQGYFFARPMPAKEFEALLQQQRPGAATARAQEEKRDLINSNDFWDPESQMALIFNSYVGGAAIVEYDGETVEALRINDRYLKVLGARREEYEPLRKNLLERISEEDRPRYLAMLKTAASTGEEAECEARSLPLHPGGEGQWIRTRVRLLAQREHSGIYYAVIENTSEQRALEERLNAIMASVPGGIALYEVGERVRTLYFNDTAAAMTGLTRQQYQALYGENAMRAVYPGDREMLTQKIQSLCMGDGGRISCTYRIAHADGGCRWVALSGAIIKRENEKVYVSALFFEVDRDSKAQAEHPPKSAGQATAVF